MKKITLIVSLMILVLTCTFTSFAALTDDEVVEIVKREGIMQGTNEGFENTKTLTRAEMTTIVVNLKGIQNEKCAISDFEDLPLEHWANEYIGVALSYGIVKGTGSNKFSPDRELTLAEAVTIILRAVADSSEIDKSGTWPSNYMNVARKENLLVGINKGNNEIINRIETARIIANLISSPHWESNTKSNETEEEKVVSKIEESIAMCGVILSVAEGSDGYTFVELDTPIGVKEYVVHDSELVAGTVLPGTYVDFWLAGTRMWDIIAEKVIELDESEKVAKVCNLSDGTIRLFNKLDTEPVILDRNNIIFLKCSSMNLTSGVMSFEDLEVGKESDINVGRYIDEMTYDEVDGTEIFYHTIDVNGEERVVAIIYVK